MSVIFILSWLFSSFAHSDDVLAPINVTAEKDLKVFTLTSSEKISNHQLETKSTALVSPHLDQVPGIVSSQNGGPGSRVSYFIRGTETKHVAFTLDGLNLNDSSNTDRHFDSAFFTSPFLKDIEVHKGPQAVLFGSDAMGGLIELTSRKGENAPETRLTVNGGSFGTIDSSLSKDWKTKSDNGTLTLSRFHSDGISRLNKKRFNGKEKDAADITQVTSSSEHRINEKIQVDLMGSYLHGKNELDGNMSDNATDKSLNDQFLLQQKTHIEISKGEVFSIRNGLNRHQRFIRSLGSGPSSFEGDLIQNELLFRKGSFERGLLSGLSAEKEDIEVSGFEREFDLYSAFLQTYFKIDKMKLLLGGRVEKHSKYGGFNTGSGGIAYELDSSVLGLQYSQGFNAPSLYQLHAPAFQGRPLGNDQLIPEVNHSWEASWKRNTKIFDSGISFFQNRLSNLISYSTADGYVNQGHFIAEGIELSGKLKKNYFELRGSFTHQNFRREEEPVIRRPYNLANLILAVFPTETTEIALKSRWHDSRKDLNENNRIVTLHSYETFDLGFKINFKESDFGIEIVNLFDRKYEELYGYNVLPRSFFFHSGFRF